MPVRKRIARALGFALMAMVAVFAVARVAMAYQYIATPSAGKTADGKPLYNEVLISGTESMFAMGDAMEVTSDDPSIATTKAESPDDPSGYQAYTSIVGVNPGKTTLHANGVDKPFDIVVRVLPRDCFSHVYDASPKVSVSGPPIDNTDLGEKSDWSVDLAGVDFLNTCDPDDLFYIENGQLKGGPSKGNLETGGSLEDWYVETNGSVQPYSEGMPVGSTGTIHAEIRTYKVQVAGGDFEVSAGKPFQVPSVTITSDTTYKHDTRTEDLSETYIGVYYPQELDRYGFSFSSNPPLQARPAGSSGAWFDFVAYNLSSPTSSFGLASSTADEFQVKEGVPEGTKLDFYVCRAPNKMPISSDNPYTTSYAAGRDEIGRFSCVVGAATSTDPAGPGEPAEKLPSTVALDPSSLALAEGAEPATVVVGGVGDGRLSASSSDPAVATASVDGSSVVVTPLGAGACTVTVTRAETDGYAEGAATLAVTVTAGQQEEPGTEPGTGTVEMYRLYRPDTTEHLFTSDPNEYDYLCGHGWRGEGVAWTAPAESDAPIWRLYNPATGEHHYTADANERAYQAGHGWDDEGVAFYGSGEAGGRPVWRLFRGDDRPGAHHFTSEENERDVLARNGWTLEGVAWYTPAA